MFKTLFLFLYFLAVVTHSVAAIAQNQEHYEQFALNNHCLYCDLQSAGLAWTLHQKAVLQGSDLSSATLKNANFSESDFTDALLIKIYAANGTFNLARFDGANLSYANAKHATFSGASFKQSNLHKANLSGANLSSSDFSGAILTGIDLSKAILIGAKITSAQLETAGKLDCAVLPDGRIFNPDKVICKVLY